MTVKPTIYLPDENYEYGYPHSIKCSFWNFAVYTIIYTLKTHYFAQNVRFVGDIKPLRWSSNEYPHHTPLRRSKQNHHIIKKEPYLVYCGIIRPQKTYSSKSCLGFFLQCILSVYSRGSGETAQLCRLP